MNSSTAFILKRAALGLALAGTLPMAAQAASGTVNFEGKIVQSTCDVTAGTRDQTVVIGTYPTSLFKAVGDTSASKGFVISLENCDAGDYTLRFDGPSPAGHPELLSVNQASGVGIEILDNNDDVFPLNQDIANPALINIPADGTATVNLKARYKSFESSVGPGLANASSTFSIEYR